MEAVSPALAPEAAELGIDRDVSRYQMGGQRIVSVTEALSLAGLVRFDHVPPDVLEEAAKRGRRVHAITARIDRGEPTGPMSADVVPYVAAYEKFKADSGFQPERIEHVVVSERFRYAGTLDRVGPLSGQRSLLDLKCVLTVPAWVGLQTAGYAQALAEAEGDPTAYAQLKRFGLRLKRDGNYSLHPCTAASDLSDFLSAVRIAQYRMRTERIPL